MRIPFAPTSESSAPLRAVLSATSRRTGRRVDEIAWLMSLFIEELAAQVECGEVVRIPGFGAFGVAQLPKCTQGRFPHLRYKPAFAPARPFRNSVGSSPLMPDSHLKLRRFRRNHAPSARPDQASARVSTTMAEFRRQLEPYARLFEAP